MRLFPLVPTVRPEALSVAVLASVPSVVTVRPEDVSAAPALPLPVAFSVPVVVTPASLSEVAPV